MKHYSLNITTFPPKVERGGFWFVLTSNTRKWLEGVSTFGAREMVVG
jgi:hypothetical protein